MSKELDPIKKGNQYSLIKSPITNPQLLMILQRTPKEHIYTRPGKGGGTWEFVTGTYVKKVLNYVFGWLWDFQIIDKGKEGDQVWVQGRLTIKNEKGEVLIIKEQFGRADVKFKRGTKTPLDYGNDLKAASTDALKKCASELGIASDIYGKNEFRDIKPPQKATPKATSVDYVIKLKSELTKRGANTEKQAVNLFNKITGLNIKSLNIAQTTAKKYLFTLLNSPSGK